MSYIVGIANYEKDILPLKNELLKEGVTVENPDGCIWLGAYLDDAKTLIGCCAVTTTKKTARFKSVYVVPEHRGHGTIYEFYKWADILVRDMGIKKITGFFNGNSVHSAIKHGYVVKSVNKNNVTFAERYL